MDRPSFVWIAANWNSSFAYFVRSCVVPAGESGGLIGERTLLRIRVCIGSRCALCCCAGTTAKPTMPVQSLGNSQWAKACRREAGDGPFGSFLLLDSRVCWWTTHQVQYVAGHCLQAVKGGADSSGGYRRVRMSGQAFSGGQYDVTLLSDRRCGAPEFIHFSFLDLSAVQC
mgnify:CR=1 FL=1